MHKISLGNSKTERISYPKKRVSSRVQREQDLGLARVMDAGEEAWQLEDRAGPRPRMCEVSFSQLHHSTSPPQQVASYSVSVLQLCLLALNTCILKREAESNRTRSSAPGSQELQMKRLHTQGNKRIKNVSGFSSF